MRGGRLQARALLGRPHLVEGVVVPGDQRGRALGLPTVLVTNESSLSDAEDFTEGYRTLRLGKVA